MRRDAMQGDAMQSTKHLSAGHTYNQVKPSMTIDAMNQKQRDQHSETPSAQTQRDKKYMTKKQWTVWQSNQYLQLGFQIKWQIRFRDVCRQMFNSRHQTEAHKKQKMRSQTPNVRFCTSQSEE